MGKPRAGVPVVVEGPAGRTQVFTNAQGQWSLYNLAGGNYQAQAQSKAPSGSVSFTVQGKGFGGGQTTVTAPPLQVR